MSEPSNEQALSHLRPANSGKGRSFIVFKGRGDASGPDDEERQQTSKLLAQKIEAAFSDVARLEELLREIERAELRPRDRQGLRDRASQYLLDLDRDARGDGRGQGLR